jgi:hypothetical protein
MVAANIVLGAQSARSQNKCLTLKVWSVAPALPQPGSYTQGTCEP